MQAVQWQCLWVAAAFMRGSVEAIRVARVCVQVIEGGMGTLAQIHCTIRLWIWRLNGSR